MDKATDWLLRLRFEREAPYCLSLDCFVTKDGRRFAGFDEWRKALG